MLQSIRRVVFMTILSMAFISTAVLANKTAYAAMQIDIYGPGKNMVNLALATPLSGPSTAATGNAPNLQNAIQQNLSFLPFMNLVKSGSVLGGTVLAGYEPPSLDFKRFQLAGSDILVTSYWPNNNTIQVRAFETNSGNRIFGKEYNDIDNDNIIRMADTICADFLQTLIGSGDFFRSTLAFIKKGGKLRSDVWLVTPTGRNLRQVTREKGMAMSPSWSPDGRFIVFTHIDERSHGLGVWDRTTNKLQRIRFPGNIVIGPTFLPNNSVAVSLSNGKNPAIFLLNSSFQRERALEQGTSINVSPTFDATGTKMAFTSSRLGGPQIFIKDLTSGVVSRVSKNGTYNSEASLSPDGTLVVYSRMTDFGHRIFVQDMMTGVERQITFGPGSDEQPSFCADNYFIAFASNRNGTRSIFITTRHGGAAKKVPTGGGECSFPRWGMPPK